MESIESAWLHSEIHFHKNKQNKTRIRYVGHCLAFSGHGIDISNLFLSLPQHVLDPSYLPVLPDSCYHSVSLSSSQFSSLSLSKKKSKQAKSIKQNKSKHKIKQTQIQINKTNRINKTKTKMLIYFKELFHVT